MGMTPRIASGPRLGSIPIPERSPSLADAAGSVVNAIGNAREADRQADRREAQIAHDLAIREQADRRSTQISQGIVALETGRVAFERQREQLRSKTDLTGYRGEAEKAWGDWSASFLAELPADAEVRQHFTAPLARMGATYQTDDDKWLAGQKAGLDAAALDEMAKGHAVTAMGAYRDDAAMGGRRKTFVEFLNTKGLTPDRYRKVIDTYDLAVGRAVVDGAENAGDVATMRALAGDVELMKRMGGADYADNVLQRATAREKAAALAAKAAVTAAQEKATDEIDRIEAVISEGGTVSQREIDSALAVGKAAGVDADRLVKLNGASMTQSVNRSFGPAGDPDGSKTRAELMRLNGVAAQRALTSEESMLHQRLTTLQGKRRADDADLLKPLANKSPQGDLSVLAEIRKRPRADRFEVAEQIRPGLGYIGLLDGATQQAAVEGFYDLKANPDLIKTKGKSGGLTDQSKTAMRAHLGIIAGQMPEAAVEGYRGVANAIYVKMQKDAGQSGWDAALYRHAINKAMGARRGGDGVWRGGLGLVSNRHVWLPDWGSAREIERLIARNPFANATYDGARPVEKADVMANFTPVLDDGGGPGEAAYYIFLNAAGQALKRKGTRETYRLLIAPGAR
jgi:hypothetical protein